MSQVYNDSNKRPRRTTRSQRNRPMLVTAQESELHNQPVEELPPADEGETTEQVPESEAAPAAPKARRLPAFFSTVGKRETESDQQEDTAAQARIARATRSKTPAEKARDDSKEKPATTTRTGAGAGSRPRSAGSPTGFKTRYIIGIGIYLLAANFLGYFETGFLQKMGLDRDLTHFNLFNNPITVRSSTLLFLATLVIVLVLLARFDLIPRNLGAATGTATGGRQSGSTSDGTRRVQPTMRQGVSGEDDDLYREYRANQRREKKR